MQGMSATFGVWRAGMTSKVLFMTGVAGVVTLLRSPCAERVPMRPRWRKL